MKYYAIVFFLFALISCHPNLAKERKKNSPYLVEADRIVLACVKYYAQHGKYPERLDDLGALFWSYAKMDIRKNPNVKVFYEGRLMAENGLSIKIESVQYDYDFNEWQKGWQESDQSF